MPGRTFAIGDVHGCAKELHALVDHLALTSDDTLVMLGDYVDRGPDSRGVIEHLLELPKSCQLVTLRGNHEVMFWQALDEQPKRVLFEWQDLWGVETVESYGGSLRKVPESHRNFLRRLKPYHDTPGHIFVHAGYDFETPMDQQSHRHLYWLHLPQYAGLPPHHSGKRVIVGHTPQKDGVPRNYGHLVCIDTQCHDTGWLTALDVDTNQYWQANELGEIRTDVLRSPRN